MSEQIRNIAVRGVATKGKSDNDLIRECEELNLLPCFGAQHPIYSHLLRDNILVKRDGDNLTFLVNYEPISRRKRQPVVVLKSQEAQETIKPQVKTEVQPDSSLHELTAETKKE